MCNKMPYSHKANKVSLAHRPKEYRPNKMKNAALHLEIHFSSQKCF